jgi:hypothetical protein
VPIERRAIQKAGYTLMRGLGDVDEGATVRLYQIINGKRRWSSDYLTKAWRAEEARAEEWKHKVKSREIPKKVRY